MVCLLCAPYPIGNLTAQIAISSRGICAPGQSTTERRSAPHPNPTPRKRGEGTRLGEIRHGAIAELGLQRVSRDKFWRGTGAATIRLPRAPTTENLRGAHTGSERAWAGAPIPQTGAGRPRALPSVEAVDRNARERRGNRSAGELGATCDQEKGWQGRASTPQARAALSAGSRHIV